MRRPVTATESQLVATLASRLPDEVRRQILSDLAASVVEPFNADETIVRFHISGYEGPNSGGQEPYPIEGRALDKDGSEVFVWIYADANRRLLELEILRVSPGPLIGPDWSVLELY